jgi:hypothetical protein
MSNLYPVADQVLEHDPEVTGDGPIQWMAKPTGDFRPPWKGEWYLSGAIIEAYQAKADMSDSYVIAEIVKAREVWEEVEEPLRVISLGDTKSVPRPE